MYISYAEKITKKKIRVTLEDGESFVLDEKDWLSFGMAVGDEIDAVFLKRLYEEYFRPKCQMKALNLLTSRDYSEKELLQKLKRSGYPDTVIQMTLEYVRSYHYLDDERYAKNYITYKGNRKSRRELSYNLSMKGIDLNAVIEAEDSIQLPDDRTTIKTLLIKRWGEHPMPEIKEKDRMTRYLARHGFLAGDVYSVYQELGI